KATSLPNDQQVDLGPTANVCFGSSADMCVAKSNVRFGPIAGSRPSTAARFLSSSKNSSSVTKVNAPTCTQQSRCRGRFAPDQATSVDDIHHRENQQHDRRDTQEVLAPQAQVQKVSALPQKQTCAGATRDVCFTPGSGIKRGIVIADMSGLRFRGFGRIRS